MIIITNTDPFLIHKSSVKLTTNYNPYVTKILATDGSKVALVLCIYGSYICAMGSVFCTGVSTSWIKKSYLGIMPVILSCYLAIVLSCKRGLLRSITRSCLAIAWCLALAWLDWSCCILLLLLCRAFYWTRRLATTILTGKQWITNKIKTKQHYKHSYSAQYYARRGLKLFYNHT